MKKWIGIFLVICITVGMFTGCGANGTSEERLSVVTTIFPVYDWVRQMLGDESGDIALTLLLDHGVDLHSYQPTAEDIVKISACDMFIYIGGESDAWVDDVLAQAKNQNMIVINLMETLGDAVKVEELVEGMEHEEEHEEEHEAENDEHIWLSLRNAAVICKAILEKLCALDPDHAAAYTANTEDYCEKLKKLDAEYQSTVDAAAVKTLLFGDRFPFRYLAEDYGIAYYAAFSGCSAESEASFETIAFLAGKVDELGLPAVMKLEGSDGKIADTVVHTCKSQDVKILTVNSMQTTTLTEAEQGVTYLGVMTSNLAALREALR